MGHRYRSQAGIVHDMLQRLNEEGGMAPTRLSTVANLPYDRLKSILERLERAGLVKRMRGEDGWIVYITEEGKETLEELKRAKTLLQQLGIRF